LGREIYIRKCKREKEASLLRLGKSRSRDFLRRASEGEREEESGKWKVEGG